MSEYVIMPKADYTAACDAIRAKTGKAELIKSGDMPSEILGIVSGGGSSADVRYVTFMSEDGTAELGKKAVATGDDCADPIARGVFSTPTKESSVQYNYTFYGWATTPNGAADSNWNKAVTEDRTVYANFISAVRYYTITYYDSDGTTVLKTESLAYGAMPSYVPTKADYTFDKWNPALTTVVGDSSYVAVWTDVISFAKSSWATISEVSQSGQAKNYFSIGDERIIPVKYGGNTYDFKARIVGFDHDDLSDGTGKAGISVMFFTTMTDKRVFHTSNWSSSLTSGWGGCNLRSFVYWTFLYYLPAELQNVLKSVNKSYNFVAKTTTNTESCKLWIPSVNEASTNTTSSYNAKLGSRYEYFTSYGYGYGNNTKTKVVDTDNTAVKEFWARDSAPASGNYNAIYLFNGNTVYTTTASGTKNVAIGFCI